VLSSRLSVSAFPCFGVFGVAAALAAGPTPNLVVEVAGQPETISDRSQNRCDPKETVDAPPRAFRMPPGPSTSTPRMTRCGNSLDGRLMTFATIAASFTAAPRTTGPACTRTASGWPRRIPRTACALIHNEFQGNLRPSLCPSRQYSRCWFNALTLERPVYHVK
jgi:hypothetical protein